MNYITIDGGTTTTRISLVCDKQIKQTVKLSVGARKSMDGGADYKGEIKSAIEKVLSDNNIKNEDIKRILASGMITSEFGLCNLPHISVPAGIQELHENMHETVISEISDIPFVFIRGVKSVSDNLSETDMMRGEETELFGLTPHTMPDALYVLPGSHSKLIKTDCYDR
jgi:2-dehydro-3-deoxygalactonokinase